MHNIYIVIYYNMYSRDLYSVFLFMSSDICYTSFNRLPALTRRNTRLCSVGIENLVVTTNDEQMLLRLRYYSASINTDHL